MSNDDLIDYDLLKKLKERDVWKLIIIKDIQVFTPLHI